MDDLIEALQIFRKYDNTSYPTHCEHDIMYICSEKITAELMTEEDVKRLDELGFNYDEEGFYSFKFGSC